MVVTEICLGDQILIVSSRAWRIDGNHIWSSEDWAWCSIAETCWRSYCGEDRRYADVNLDVRFLDLDGLEWRQVSLCYEQFPIKFSAFPDRQSWDQGWKWSSCPALQEARQSVAWKKGRSCCPRQAVGPPACNVPKLDWSTCAMSKSPGDLTVALCDS